CFLHDCGVDAVDILEFEGKITAAPNPVADQLTIESTVEELLSIDLINVFGQKMHQARLEGPKNQIEVSGLPQGTYFLRVFNAEQQLIKVFKIQKI
ncbi:MAG: T9SS type A sorting domain-containing protein, partial [Proteobacteria bacterium]|nr:T9SS type A sorting domain-containing protein [Pseudomonadota bacterium]